MANKIRFTDVLPTVKELSKLMAVEALRRNNGDIRQAAKALKISQKALKRLIFEESNYDNLSLKHNRVKCALIYALVIFILLLNPETLYASNGVYSKFNSAIDITTGILTAYAIHEGGHVLAAGLTGSNLFWKVGSYNQPLGYTEYSNTADIGLAISGSGLMAQAAAAEFILQSNSIDKNSNLIRGFMLWNFVNPIVYAFDYWFIHKSNKKVGNSYQGDIQGVQHYGNKEQADIFAAAVISTALFQGYRFINMQNWESDMFKGRIGAAFFTPTLDEGVFIKYELKF